MLPAWLDPGAKMTSQGISLSFCYHAVVLCVDAILKEPFPT